MSDSFVDLEGEDKVDDEADPAKGEQKKTDGDDGFVDLEGKGGTAEAVAGGAAATPAASKKAGKGGAKNKAGDKTKKDAKTLAQEKALARLHRAAAELEDEGTPGVLERLAAYRIYPGARDFLAWECGIAFCVLYQAIAVPFFVGMSLKKDETWPLAICPREKEKKDHTQN